MNKIIMLLTCLIICVSVLTACGDKDKQGDSSESVGGTTDSSKPSVDTSGTSGPNVDTTDGNDGLAGDNLPEDSANDIF